jgi:hypothetical protein
MKYIGREKGVQRHLRTKQSGAEGGQAGVVLFMVYYRHKISYKMISNILAYVEYSPSSGQKTVDLIKIMFLAVFWS